MRITLFFLLCLTFAASLFSQTPQMYLTRGHADDISAIALSRDGRLMASGGEDNKVFIWDVASGRMQIEIDRHQDELTALIFSSDGKLLLSSGDDNKSFIWNAKNGDLVKELSLSKSQLCASEAAEGKYLLTAGMDGTLHIWDAKNFDVVKALEIAPLTSVLNLFVPKTGKIAYTFEVQSFPGKSQSQMYVSKWNLGSLTRESRKEWPHKDYPEGVNDDGSLFLLHVGGNDPLEMYSTTDFSLKETISKENWPVFTEKYLEGDLVLGEIKSAYDRNLKDRVGEFNFRTNQLTSVYEELGTEVDDPYISPRKDLLVFLDERFKDDRLTIVSRQAKIALQTTLNLSALASNVWTHPGKPWISCHTRSAGFTILDLAQGEQIRLEAEMQKFAQEAWFSPDGQKMLVNVYRKGIQCIDLGTMQVLYSIAGDLSFPSVAFNPNGKTFSLTDEKRQKNLTVIYDLETGAEKMRVPELKPGASFPLFTDSLHLVVQNDEELGVFDIETQKYTPKTSPDAKGIENAGVGSAKLPQDMYRISFNQVRNELILGNRRTMLILDPQTFQVKKKYTWPGGLADLIYSFSPSPDGNYVAGGTNRGEIILWDLNAGNFKTIAKAHTVEISGPIRWMHDSRYLLSYARDGGIKFWDPKTGAFVGNYVNTDDEEFLIYTSDNYYFSTKGALPFIGFKLKNKIYPYEQFDLKFNRPDQVLKKFAYASKLKEKILLLAYQKRLKRLGFSEEQLASDFHVPETEVLARETLPVLTAEGKVKFKISALDSKFPLYSLHLMVNEVPVLGKLGEKVKVAPGTALEREFELNLSPGRNQITVSVKNDQGTESTREGFMVYCTKEFPKPNLLVLAIGVSEFKESQRNLTYAAKDARDFVARMKLAKNYGEIKSWEIFNADATRQKVESMKAELEKSSENDLVIIYLSSHGLLDEQLDYFLAMNPTQFEHPAEGGLPYSSLENLLDGIPARNRLILIDACHSGEVDKDEPVTWKENSNDGLLATARSGPAAPSPKAGLNNSFEYMKALFAEVSSDLGATVISAAGGYEFAFESKDWNNGVFTYSLLDGLKSNHADQNHDKMVTISELRNFVVARVFALTKGAQMPTVRKANPVIDFRVD
ncbi:MAG: caspase family protein [Bacteroidia bacterium]|nr:caspase family protein [Bacteroidia bacterium]